MGKVHTHLWMCYDGEPVTKRLKSGTQIPSQSDPSVEKTTYWSMYYAMVITGEQNGYNMQTCHRNAKREVFDHVFQTEKNGGASESVASSRASHVASQTVFEMGYVATANDYAGMSDGALDHTSKMVFAAAAYFNRTISRNAEVFGPSADVMTAVDDALKKLVCSLLVSP